MKAGCETMNTRRAKQLSMVQAGPLTPRFYTVERRVRELSDVVSIDVPTGAGPMVPATFLPGQFNMLYVYGIGEVAISISGDPAATDRMTHTIRAVGRVSQALARLKRGDLVGVRGPFGSNWPIAEAAGSDIVIIAGGIGLAPLRPVICHLMNHRQQYGRVALLYGARNPEHLIYRKELDRWRASRDFQVRITVDHADPGWVGDVGLVTKLLPKIRVEPVDTVAMICGPEVMIRFSALALVDMGVAPERIFVSLERNMKCAVGWCGHCQFGPHFICKDGPVFPFGRISSIMGLREI